MEKIIVITGGGTGIGASLTKTLSDEGNKIIICGRREKPLKKIAASNENISYHKCDVSKEKEVIRFKNFIEKRFGYIDVLINAAGVFGEIGRFDQTDSDRWKKTIEINLYGTYFVNKHLLNLLLKSEVKKIVNFVGGGAFNAFPNYSAYAVSKAGVARFSECISKELETKGVAVNCIAPGFVSTDIQKQTLDAGRKKAGEKYYKYTLEKLKKGSVPIDTVVNCVKFLISKESDGLNGKTISASFDRWDSKIFKKYIPKINSSDLFTSRRINPRNLEEKEKVKRFAKDIIDLYK